MVILFASYSGLYMALESAKSLAPERVEEIHKDLESPGALFAFLATRKAVFAEDFTMLWCGDEGKRWHAHLLNVLRIAETDGRVFWRPENSVSREVYWTGLHALLHKRLCPHPFQIPSTGHPSVSEWNMRAVLAPLIGEDNTHGLCVYPGDRGREKQALRDQDQRDLASGQKTPNQLHQENAHFFQLRLRVNFGAAKSLG